VDEIDNASKENKDRKLLCWTISMAASFDAARAEADGNTKVWMPASTFP
jgi:hypothetical protein